MMGRIRRTNVRDPIVEAAAACVAIAPGRDRPGTVSALDAANGSPTRQAPRATEPSAPNAA